MADKATHTVEIEGYIMSTYRKVGDRITLTPKQARVFEIEGRIAPISAASKPRATKAKAGPKTEPATAEE